MKIYSFIQQGIELFPIEVEISLVPGLPRLHILGLPDTAIKESQIRIKAALKNQGYQWPRHKQILVNLKPSYLKKKSRGLDLAIACSYLWKTQQVPLLQGQQEVYVYGELGLDGEVITPNDLDSLVDGVPHLITGSARGELDFPYYEIHNLKQLTAPCWVEPKSTPRWRRPEPPAYKFSVSAAQLMMVSALGQHSTLIVGPSGSGKTTVTEALYHLQADPSPQEYKEIQRISRWMGKECEWRPFVSPHHTTPSITMIGGGSPIFPGEITRAHRGVLILDELLEFRSEVKEALREPMEKSHLVICRRGEVKSFPAQFHLLATSNLCPCGDLTPNKRSQCRFSLTRCQSYMQKLSGPILDRFALLSYSDQWEGERDIGLNHMMERLTAAREFIGQRGQVKSNHQLSMAEIRPSVDDFVWDELLPKSGHSVRRQQSIMRVARSFADLSLSETIEREHLREALVWSYRSFYQLRNLFI